MDYKLQGRLSSVLLTTDSRLPRTVSGTGQVFSKNSLTTCKVMNSLPTLFVVLFGSFIVSDLSHVLLYKSLLVCHAHPGRNVVCFTEFQYRCYSENHVLYLNFLMTFITTIKIPQYFLFYKL